MKLKKAKLFLRFFTMKYLNFLLITSVIFCYTGISSKAHHSLGLTSGGKKNTSREKCHNEEISRNSTTSDYYQNTETTKHETLKCCHYMLPNAPNSHDFNLGNTLLYTIAANIPTLRINKTPIHYLSLEIKREYQPPDLFLQNSSFLL